MNKPYHKATDMNTMKSHLETFGVHIEASKMKDANVLVLRDLSYNGNIKVMYVLGSVKPPERKTKVYLSDKNEIITVDITELFKITQDDKCVCWMELD